MDEKADDLLEAVVHALQTRLGDLSKIARETGIPYDTVRRIKNRENEPGYFKVRALHKYLFGAPATPIEEIAADVEPTPDSNPAEAAET